jgi:hypothetical protein
MSNPPYKFGSPLWFAALHGIMAQRAVILAERFPEFSSSICEVFYDAPRSLSKDGRLAFSCVSEGPTVDFQLRERDGVQFKSVAEFSTVEAIARFDTRDDPRRLEALMRMASDARSAGKIVNASGDRFIEPGDLEATHNLIARITA